MEEYLKRAGHSADAESEARVGTKRKESWESNAEAKVKNSKVVCNFSN
jgi:hypothetical protein